MWQGQDLRARSSYLWQAQELGVKAADLPTDVEGPGMRTQFTCFSLLTAKRDYTHKVNKVKLIGAPIQVNGSSNLGRRMERFFWLFP